MQDLWSVLYNTRPFLPKLLPADCKAFVVALVQPQTGKVDFSPRSWSPQQVLLTLTEVGRSVVSPLAVLFQIFPFSLSCKLLRCEIANCFHGDD